MARFLLAGIWVYRVMHPTAVVLYRLEELCPGGTLESFASFMSSYTLPYFLNAVQVNTNP